MKTITVAHIEWQRDQEGWWSSEIGCVALIPKSRKYLVERSHGKIRGWWFFRRNSNMDAMGPYETMREAMTAGSMLVLKSMILR